MERALKDTFHLEILGSDSNSIEYFEAGEMDSARVVEFNQQNFDAQLVCVFVDEEDSQFVEIDVAFADSVYSKSNFNLSLAFPDAENGLASLVQKIEAVFAVAGEKTDVFRILIANLADARSDDLDSIKYSLENINLENFQCRVIEISDSLAETAMRDSVLLQAAIQHHAGLVLTGTFETLQDSVRRFSPILLIVNEQNEANASLDEMNAIKGKTCRLGKVSMPAMPVDNLQALTEFIAALFSMEQKNFKESIHLLGDADFFAGVFYLAESYLSRGVEREKDVTLARADWDSTIVNLKKCFDFPLKSRDSVFVNNNLGVAFQLLGNLDSAMVYFSKANSRLASLKSHMERLRVSGNYGNILLLSGQWKPALDIFQASVEDMKMANDSLTLAVTYENLGNIYQLIMQRNRAIQYYNQALELRQAMHDNAGAALTLLYLGNVHHEKDEYETAKNYFLQGLGLHRQTHNEPGVADTYDRLGQVFQNLGEADSARIYFQKSIDLLTELDDASGLVRTMLHLASSYSSQKDFDRAMELYEQALPIANTSEIKSLSAQIYDRMGDIYNNQNQLISAYDNYDEAAELYEQVGNMESLSLILYNMGLIRLKQNDYGDGYQLMKRAIDLDDEHGFNNLSGERDFLKELQIIMESSPNN